MIAAFEGLPVVIEFRHKEWIRESVFEGLVQRKASVAFCDMPQLKAPPNANHGTLQAQNRMEADDMTMSILKGS